MRPCEPALPAGLLSALLVSAWPCAGVAVAGDTVTAGRYLDVSVRVEAPAQLNPLHMIGDLQFTGRMTVGAAVRTALAGTGYRLAESSRPQVRALLESRLAIPHLRFERKRIDAVIAALVGAGRGYDVQVDHAARLLRVVVAGPSQDRRP